jgi:hypothetical protein
LGCLQLGGQCPTLVGDLDWQRCPLAQVLGPRAMHDHQPPTDEAPAENPVFDPVPDDQILHLLLEMGAGWIEHCSTRQEVKSNPGTSACLRRLGHEPPSLHASPVSRSGRVNQDRRRAKWNGSGDPSSVAWSVAAPAEVSSGDEGEGAGRWRLPTAVAPPEPLTISENDHRDSFSQ